MVYAVAEPYLLQVLLEGLEVLGLAVALVVGVYVLQELADLEVVHAVLVPDDVAAHLSGLGEVVEHYLLVQGEAVELGDLVSENLDVGEPVDVVVEVLVDHGACGERGHGAKHQCGEEFIHNNIQIKNSKFKMHN